MSRRSWLIVVLSILVIALAAVWAGGWFFVRGQVEAEIDRRIERAALQGLKITCADRRIEGFPFAIVVACAPLTVINTNAAREMTIARIHVDARIYTPQRIDVTMIAPFGVRELGPGGRDVVAATWTKGGATLALTGAEITGVSTTFDALDVAFAGAPNSYRAAAATLDLARTAGSGPTAPLDIAARISALEGSLNLPGITGKTDVEVKSVLAAVAALQGVSAQDQLRNWTRAGGRLRIDVLRLVSQGAALEASGDIGLDPRGRVDGALRLLVHDLERIFRDLVQQRVIPREMLSAVPTLNAVSKPAEISGRKAIAVPIAVREGLIRVGPVPIGAVPPLF